MESRWTELGHRIRWAVWRRWPGWIPVEVQRKIFELSPYACRQIGQGSPMVVMRKAAWDAGEYEEIPGAGCNVDGEMWILREWLREHPGWRP